MDVLSDVIAAVRLSGGVFLDARFTAPWSVLAGGEDEEFPLLEPLPAHIIAYHYVVAGRLYVEVAGAPAQEVGAGEIVLLPRNDAHVLSSEPGLSPAVVDHLVQAPSGGSPALLRCGGGGEPAHVVCGYLGCGVPNHPLVATLPAVLTLDMRRDGGDDWVRSALAYAAGSFAHGGIGSAAVLGKLAELLFVEAIRRYMAGLPSDGRGWLAGLQDRVVGRALALMHDRDTCPWTTESLAKAVGLSRSAFAERFTSLLGMPPMHYLASWRLQQAARRLRESATPTSQIAEAVGYGSDAAFCRAFKREFGVTPGAWRRGAARQDCAA